VVWLYVGGGAALFSLGILVAHLYARATRPSYRADAARLARARDRRDRETVATEMAAAEAEAVARVSVGADVDGAIEFMRELGAGDSASDD
jgi:hypothetical protein